MAKYLIGSQYFFSDYEDFKSKDIDEIELIETNEFSHMRQITGRGKCLFQLKKLPSVEEYVVWDISTNIGMNMGKYLIPEFCQEIGFSFKDLPKISPLIERLDEKHLYEKIIYDSYIANNDFILTPEQRALAYESYKTSRGM